MNFTFGGGEATPERVVEVTLAQRSKDVPPVTLVTPTPTSAPDPTPTSAPDPTLLPLTVRLGTGVKSFGNGVEVSVTQIELYDPAKAGDKERAAAAAFDWFFALMQNRGGQLSQMLAEVQRVNPSCQFDMRSGWSPSGSTPTPPQANPMLSSGMFPPIK